MKAKKILLLHCPRTAGRKFSRAVGCDKTHLPYRLAERRMNDYDFVFTIARNVWERAHSFYCLHRFHKKATHPIYNKPFNEWVLTGCKTHYKNYDPLDGLSYVGHKNFAVNHVAFWMNLHNEFKMMRQKYNISTLHDRFTFAPETDRAIHRKEYNDNAAEYIYERYIDEIKYFGWRF